MKYFVECGQRTFACRFERDGETLLAHLEVDGATRTLPVDVARGGDGRSLMLLLGGRSHDVVLERCDGKLFVHAGGERIAVTVADERERAARQVAHQRAGGRREVRAAMPGVVVDVLVEAGARVAEGQTLCILDAMKMQNPVPADAPGLVGKVHCRKGQAVAAGALLLELEAT